MCKQITTLQWECNAPFDITPNQCRPLSLVCPLSGWFKHQVREALRQTTLAKAHERKDMAGIENGHENEHAVALIRSEELSDEDQAIFRDILQGRAVTKDRTSHTEIIEAIEKGAEVTARKKRKWRQCDACMRETSGYR